jgi:hypothetical protein
MADIFRLKPHTQQAPSCLEGVTDQWQPVSNPFFSMPDALCFTLILNSSTSHFSAQVGRQSYRSGPQERQLQEQPWMVLFRGAVSSSASTADVFWRAFFGSLLGNGLHEIQMQKPIALMGRSDVWTQVAVGTDVTLARLSQSYTLGMVGNADGHLELVLPRLGLARFFPFIVDSGNERFKKPDREIFLLALDRLGYLPSAALYVGDNETAFGASHLGPARSQPSPCSCGRKRVRFDTEHLKQQAA